jgi:hypothetical protein
MGYRQNPTLFSKSGLYPCPLPYFLCLTRYKALGGQHLSWLKSFHDVGALGKLLGLLESLIVTKGMKRGWIIVFLIHFVQQNRERVSNAIRVFAMPKSIHEQQSMHTQLLPFIYVNSRNVGRNRSNCEDQTRSSQDCTMHWKYWGNGKRKDTKKLWCQWNCAWHCETLCQLPINSPFNFCAWGHGQSASPHPPSPPGSPSSSLATTPTPHGYR